MLFLLRLIPRSRESRFVVALAVLVVLLIIAMNKIVQLKNELAAKPKIEIHTVVETKIVEKIVEKKVAGPVVIREKIIRMPGGGKTTERVIERGSVTTETANETANEIAKYSDRYETPGSLSSRLWSITASFNPIDYKKNPAFGFSRAFGIMSIGYSHDLGKGVTLKGGQHINLGLSIF